MTISTKGPRGSLADRTIAERSVSMESVRSPVAAEMISSMAWMVVTS
jgi:hypothetical protein